MSHPSNRSNRKNLSNPIKMYEIEAKVPLKRSDVQRLRKEILKIAAKKVKVIKKDFYYSTYPKKAFFLRIREKNGKPFLNLKTKKVEQGIELNQEIKLPLTSASKFHVLLKKIGIPLTAKKEKTGEIFKKGNMQIELNFVKGLGYFLEIETIVKSKTEIPKAKKALRELFSQLGFKPGDFEKKYYLELLEEKRKNR